MAKARKEVGGVGTQGTVEKDGAPLGIGTQGTVEKDSAPLGMGAEDGKNVAGAASEIAKMGACSQGEDRLVECRPEEGAVEVVASGASDLVHAAADSAMQDGKVEAHGVFHALGVCLGELRRAIEAAEPHVGTQGTLEKDGAPLGIGTQGTIEKDGVPLGIGTQGTIRKYGPPWAGTGDDLRELFERLKTVL